MHYKETQETSLRNISKYMTRLLSQFSRSMTEALGLFAPKTIGVAVSGGVDSIALASLASLWCKNKATKLKAFVVDHRLRENSLEEAQAVSKYLTEKFNLETSTVSLNRLEDYSSDGVLGSNLEELARIARRRSLLNACQAEGVTHLLMGHHMNDQIELFIQRLISGSSWFGLAGMRKSAPMTLSHRGVKGPKSVRIIRPLLDLSKKELIEWCQKNDIRWWEDPSNADIDLTKRNLIRRMYQLGAEPIAFAEERVKDLLGVFNGQRELAINTANYVTKQLSLRGDLKRMPDQGSATLIVSNELKNLPKIILSEVLFRIVAPISPLDDNKLSTRRRKLDSVAEMIQRKSDDILEQNVTILGVQISQTGPRSPVIFARERPRHNNGVKFEVFKATHEWSDWVLYDNRWFLRWKLPASEIPSDFEGISSRYFTIRLAVDSSELLDAITPVLPTGLRRKLKHHINTHPLLMWSDCRSSDQISREDIIGFPTLEATASLKVEVIPKSCEF